MQEKKFFPFFNKTLMAYRNIYVHARVVCTISMWEMLQKKFLKNCFKLNIIMAEIASETFCDNFFYFQRFCQKTVESKSPKEVFFRIYFHIRHLASVLNTASHYNAFRWRNWTTCIWMSEESLRRKERGLDVNSPLDDHGIPSVGSTAT